MSHGDRWRTPQSQQRRELGPGAGHSCDPTVSRASAFALGLRASLRLLSVLVCGAFRGRVPCGQHLMGPQAGLYALGRRHGGSGRPGRP